MKTLISSIIFLINRCRVDNLIVFIIRLYYFSINIFCPAIIIIMIILCFAPLSVADDTTRMVGLIWLPTYLLIREIDLKSALESVRFRQWALVACLLQVLLPPMLLYQHGVAPFSCYSRELISRFLPRERDITNFAVKPFGLYALDRGDLYDSIVCWPPRLIRLPRH